MTEVEIRLQINGEWVRHKVPPRTLLSDFLRNDLALTGTHVGCEHGVCGACTVLINGRSARACLVFASQLDGDSVQTVESLADASGALSPLQEAFRDAHGLQCGFCTPGFLMLATEYLRDHPSSDRSIIREVISGNLCRCTGYETIIDAVANAANVAGRHP